MKCAKYQQLLQTLGENEIIITATQRLADFLEYEYAIVQSEAEKSVWVKPHIFSFSTWLKSIWVTARLESNQLLLSELQAHILWQKVIQASGKLPLTLAEGTAQLESAAKLAGEGLNLIQEWQVPFPFSCRMFSEDIHMFQDWAISFKTLCRKNHWLIFSDLPDYFTEKFQTGVLIPPQKITLVGFGELNRAYQSLLTTLCDLGTCVEYYADDFAIPVGLQDAKLGAEFTRDLNYFESKKPKEYSLYFEDFPTQNNLKVDVKSDASVRILKSDRYVSSINRLELDSVDIEILTMAHWAKSTLQRNPMDSFIGCVVPKLEQRRSLVLQTFRDVFADHEDAFALSAPTRFDKISLIHILFKLFELGESNINLQDLELLLRTPFVGAAEKERVPRAKLAVHLKTLVGSNVSIDRMLKLAGEEHQPFYCPLWRQQVINFRALLAEINTKRWLPSFFAEKLIDALQLLGWPSSRQLTADEIQVLQRLQQILKEFARLDLICGEMTLKQARSQLEWMTKQILFQPRVNETAPVQILGMLEPAGMWFTDLWIMGLNDEVWPKAQHPHPFIPLELQCQFDLPHSSALRELKFSQQLTRQFCHLASRIIFSSAKQDGDVRLRPSRLLDEFKTIEVAELNLPIAVHQSIDDSKIEYLIDDYAPVIPKGQRLKGGAYLFELQSACPFRAFAEIRLQAKALEKAQAHLSAKERGSLLHRALELVWRELKNQSQLLNQPDEVIHQLVVKSVTAAMAEMYADRLDRLASGFNRIEQRCLVNLIEKWLFLHERKRSAFQIDSLEKIMQVELVEHFLQLKIDRIDTLCVNDKRLLIDYKMGAVTEKDWFGERPNKPQLPLYCITSEVPMSGILFAQLKAGQLAFKGLVAEEIEIEGAQTLSNEDWLTQKENWNIHLEHLASQFTQGYAKVDPKEGAETCRFCQLKMFCRVGEW